MTFVHSVKVVFGGPAEKLLSAAAGLAVLAVIIATFNHAAPPLQDYPEWIWQGWLLNALWSGDPDISAFVEFVGVPVPNSTSQVVIGLLSFVFPPLLAGKLLILIYVLLGGALAWSISRQAPEGVKGSVRILLIMGIILSSGFWNGYINYQLGLLIVAAFLWWTLRNDGPAVQVDARRLVLIGLVGILAFFSHAIVLGGFVVIVATCAVVWRSPKRFLSLIPALILTLWYLAGLRLGMLQSQGGLSLVWLDGPIEAISYKIYTAGKWGPFMNFYAGPKASMLQVVPALYWFGVALNLAFGSLLLGWAMWGAARNWPGFWKATPIAATTAAVCILGYLLLPFSSFLGVSNFGERLLGIGLVAALIGVVHTGTLKSAVPFKSLAVVALLGVTYLIVPAVILAPRDTVLLEAVSGQRANRAAYYSDQRYYNSRPFANFGRIKLLAAPGTKPSIPEVVFETGFLKNTQP